MTSPATNRATDTAKEMADRASKEIVRQVSTFAQALEGINLQLAEGMDAVILTSQEQAARGLDQMVGLWRDQTARSGQMALKALDDMAAIGRLQLDTALTINLLAARGAGAIQREIDGFNRMAFDKGMAAATRVLEARSLHDVIAIQTDFVKQSVDDALTEAGKLSELAAKAADETIAPLNARVSDAVVQFGQRQAA